MYVFLMEVISYVPIAFLYRLCFFSMVVINAGVDLQVKSSLRKRSSIVWSVHPIDVVGGH